MSRFSRNFVIFGIGFVGLGLLVMIIAGAELGFGIGPQRALEVTIWLLLTALFIVSRKRGVEALQLRQKMLKGQQLELAFREQALNEHSNVVTTDTAGRIKAVNANFTKALGHASTDVEGKLFVEFLDTDQPGLSDEILAKTRGGKVWSGDIRFLSSDKTVRILDTTAVPMSDQYGNHSKTVFLAVDVTAQRIGDEERQLIRCLQLLPEDVYMFDPDKLKVIYMNSAAARRLRLDDAEYGSLEFPEITGEVDNTLLRTCARHIAKGTDAPTRFEMDCAGTVMEATLQIIQTTDRKKRCVAVLRDISERKAAEDIRQRFIMMMTHELRTPLTSIKGAIQLLTAGAAGEIGPGALSMLSIAEKNSERLLRLVNDILDFGKLEAGKMEFEMERIDMRQLIEEAVESDREFASGFDVTFRCDLPYTPLYVSGDRGRLQQVLSNLLSNATKFSRPGDRVDVGARLVGGRVSISVCDRGPGIPEIARATLFDPFTQFSGQENAKASSSGLGLTIVKAIVDKHGGDVDFRSSVGEGTTFYVNLPELKDAVSHHAA